MNERAIQNTILIALGKRPDLGRFWRQNTGAARSLAPNVCTAAPLFHWRSYSGAFASAAITATLAAVVSTIHPARRRL